MVYDNKTGAYYYKPRFDKVPMDQVSLAMLYIPLRRLRCCL